MPSIQNVNTFQHFSSSFFNRHRFPLLFSSHIEKGCLPLSPLLSPVSGSGCHHSHELSPCRSWSATGYRPWGGGWWGTIPVSYTTGFALLPSEGILLSCLRLAPECSLLTSASQVADDYSHVWLCLATEVFLFKISGLFMLKNLMLQAYYDAYTCLFFSGRFRFIEEL